MTAIPLATGDWKRELSDEPDLTLLNRFFEENPANQETQVALLERPGFRRWLTLGEGPIRATYSQPGSFADALFVVDYDKLYRVDVDETVTNIGGSLIGSSLRASPSMAATARLGTTPEFLYVADGRNLWLYAETGFATGRLAASGAIASGDEIKIDSTYYQWTSSSVDTGTPDGSVSDPWLVDLGSDNVDALTNMVAAINGTGTAGTTYSTDLTAHASVQGGGITFDSLTVSALTAGSAANSIATTVETGANLAWDASTLEGGGDPSLTQVVVPNDLGIVAVGFIAGFIVCVVTQGQGYNGRWYWIEPGETTIDPLDFATAERAPDPLYSVRVVGDQFWLPGSDTTEIWYPTGDETIPFLRVQGRVFDRGVWEGTDVENDGEIIVVDRNGVVYVVGPGGPVRVSDSSIEERIREAQAAEVANGL